MIDPAVREILDGTPIAHLATTSPDGAPHCVPVWIGTHQGHIAFLTGPDAKKARNLRRDPRVAISIAPAENPFVPVIIRGHVTHWLDGEQACHVVDALATKYTGQPYPRDQERVIAVVEATHQSVGMR